MMAEAGGGGKGHCGQGLRWRSGGGLAKLCHSWRSEPMARMFATFAMTVFAVALATHVSTAQAADPPTGSGQAGGESVISSPEKLLESLSNPDWRERRDAIHQLIQLGPAGDEAVKNLLKRNLDHEQRKNVGLALQLIEDNRLFGPSLITLHVSGATAANVFKSIGEQ